MKNAETATKLRLLAKRHRAIYGNDAKEAADLETLADAITGGAATKEQMLAAIDATIRLFEYLPGSPRTE